MATATVSGTSVTFSNSTAAANLTTSIYESNTSSSYLTAFDVLAASGGGTKTTVYSVDDGVKSTSIATNTGFTTYNTDLLYKDGTGIANAETSLLGAKFWIGADSKIYYDASALAGQINHLGVGEKLTDSFQYTIKMSNGTLSVGTLTVDLKGINDAVVITGADATGKVTEDASSPNLSTTGSIAFTDADYSDVHTTSVSAASGNTLGGSLSMGAVSELATTEAGTVGWTYSVANSATQYLAKGQFATETFTVTVDDNHGGAATQNVTVTVVGVNDDVTLVSDGSDVTGNVTEDDDAILTDSGLINFNDVDLVDHHEVTYSKASGTLGDLSFGAVSESDTTEAGSVTWTYTHSAADFQHLGADETATETFDVAITDNQGSTAHQTVTVTVQGENDKVTIEDASNLTGTVYEDDAPTTLTDTGTIFFNDVDLTDVHTTAVEASEDNTLGGTLVMDSVSETADTEGGSAGWTYSVANSAVQYLGAGETATETFTVTVDDHHGSKASKDITVTVHGVNDEASIGAGANSDNAVTESGDTPSTNLTAGGKLSISDLDHDQSLLNDASTGDRDGTYGTFHVAADGTWSYDLNDSAVNALGAGVTRTDTIAVTSLDGTGHFNITVTITGTNDSPVISAANSTYSINENATGLIHDFDATDVDTLETSDTLSWSLLNNDDGNFAIDADGKLSLVNAQNYETTTSLSVTVKVADQHGGSATKDITLNINDLPEGPVAHILAPTGTDTNNNDSFGSTPTAGNPTLHDTGGSKNDTFTGDDTAQTIDGLGGDDILSGRGGNDTIIGGAGADNLYGGAGNDNITGGAQADSIFGGSGDDNLTGNEQADTIYGGDGNDVINGSEQNDLLIGGNGNDTITGGVGATDADTFKFGLASGEDTITDFASGTDKLDFTGLGITSYSTTTLASHGLYFDAAAHTLYGDTDGNGSDYEFAIHLTGVSSLNFISVSSTTDDFVL